MPDSQKLIEYGTILKDLGKTAAHYLYPNDFEVYICSLELVDSSDQTVDMFVFPVMPEQLAETNTPVMSINKTAGGITVLSTVSFTPTEISIKGNFGKKFKILVGRDLIEGSAVSFSTDGGASNLNYFGELNTNQKSFSNTIKTGYGALKILQSIVFKANMLDRNNNPFRLYFYNPALGNNYLVKATSLTQRQSKDTNMIWNYELSLRSVAPITVRSLGNNQYSLVNMMSYDNISKYANAGLDMARGVL